MESSASLVASTASISRKLKQKLRLQKPPKTLKILKMLKRPRTMLKMLMNFLVVAFDANEVIDEVCPNSVYDPEK